MFSVASTSNSASLRRTHVFCFIAQSVDGGKRSSSGCFIPFAVTYEKRGSILLETLLTVVILSVGLTVIVQGVTAAYRASRMGWRYSEAALALENVTVENIFQGGPDAGAENGSLEKPFDRYRYKLASQAAMINGSLNERINEVSVSVEWNEGLKSHAVDLQTFLFNTVSSESGEN